MLLSEVKKNLSIIKTLYFKDKIIFNKISSTSKDLDKKTILIVSSKKKISNKYLKEAIKKKIPAILSDKVLSNIPITQIIVKNISKEKQKLLNYIKPYKPSNIIAVTGTNGKTSVAWYISEICRLNNINVKMQGTLGYFINGKKIREYELTTPDYETLYQNSYTKNKNNYTFVFEASSHSLHQNRLGSIPVNIAAITNISHDHLDYHKSFTNYKNSKFKLFKKYLNHDGCAVVNSNLKNTKKLINILKKRNLKKIEYGNKGIFFKEINSKSYLIVNKKKFELKKIFFSKIEKENLLCAISCCLQINIKIKSIINILNKIKSPPGRLQVFNLRKNHSKVVVDYAHTPDALKNILLTFTENNKKPSLVFGCGGDRDKEKRKLMGQIANSFASKVYVTDDNPRNETPSSIRKAILKYCKKGEEIANRKNAIKKSIQNLKNNSILIISGKGHEKYQIIKNKYLKFDDAKTVKQIINKI
ncbi:MAG: hypothetical protein CMP16_00665 [Rickettsiales bacterium]|nr:hypothetical protein [Rickettsiales bacterium]